MEVRTTGRGHDLGELSREGSQKISGMKKEQKVIEQELVSGWGMEEGQGRGGKLGRDN